MSRYKGMQCPFCGGMAHIVVCDEEGNIQGDEYEQNPWSGLAYGISHTTDDQIGGECPIATEPDDDYLQGRILYDSRDEAYDAWATRVF